MKGINAKIQVLSQDEITAIHKSTLRILENVGVKVPNKDCIEMCRKIGAIVDEDNYVVKIPASVMEGILLKVKKADKGKRDYRAEEIKGNISTQVFIVDYIKGLRRYGLKDDVMKGISLVQHLDNIPTCNAVVIPSDVPHNMTDIVSYQMIYTYSEKPGGTYILSAESARYIIEMSKVMGKEAGYLLEAVSPLQFRKESLEMALIFAKEVQPIHMGPMVMGGSTGPMTVAGAVTLHNAEVLASLFVIYALTGKFAAYCAATHFTDLRTMICSFGSPNQSLLGMCTAQMGRFYNLSSISNSGLTDAMVPDFQGGFEKASSAIFSCLAGTNGIGAQGIVGADQGISLEQLVIDNEWMDAYNYIIKGIEVSEETIAADIIESVGIAGNYLVEEHTAKHMRENYWVSKLFIRDNWEMWKNNGSKDIFKAAHEYVNDVTSNYKNMEPVISASKINEIDYIIRKAEQELTTAKYSN